MSDPLSNMPGGLGNFYTTAAVVGISVTGAVTKSTQWVDAKTGKFSWLLMISGVATCLIMAAVVRALGEQYHVEPLAQVMITGVLCYVGPDPIIRGLASIALKKVGVGSDSNDAGGKSAQS